MILTSRYKVRLTPDDKINDKLVQEAKDWCRKAILRRLQLDRIIADLDSIEYRTDHDEFGFEAMVIAVLDLGAASEIGGTISGRGEPQAGLCRLSKVNTHPRPFFEN